MGAGTATARAAMEFGEQNKAPRPLDRILTFIGGLNALLSLAILHRRVQPGKQRLKLLPGSSHGAPRPNKQGRSEINKLEALAGAWHRCGTA